MVPPFPGQSLICQTMFLVNIQFHDAAHFADLSIVFDVDGYNGYKIALYPAANGWSACESQGQLDSTLLRWIRRAISGVMTNIQASSFECATTRVQRRGKGAS